MIKQRILREELTVDSHARKLNGSCPLMPEEVLISEFIIIIFIVAEKRFYISIASITYVFVES